MVGRPTRAWTPPLQQGPPGPADPATGPQGPAGRGVEPAYVSRHRPTRLTPLAGACTPRPTARRGCGESRSAGSAGDVKGCTGRRRAPADTVGRSQHCARPDPRPTGDGVSHGPDYEGRRRSTQLALGQHWTLGPRRPVTHGGSADRRWAQPSQLALGRHCGRPAGEEGGCHGPEARMDCA